MKQSYFSCPKCGNPVPKRKAVFMTNFTKLRCEKCGAKIRPERKVLSLIGGIGGGIGGGLGGLIGVYGINSGNWATAGFLFMAQILVLLLVGSFFTVKFTTFIEAQENV